jgi:hypothetical protein
MTPEENRRLQQRGVRTYKRRFSVEQRRGFSRQGGLAAIAKHPELKASGNAALRAWQNSTKGRTFLRKNAKKLWSTPAIRERIVTAIRKAAIDRRIPLRLKNVRPTAHERRMIRLCRSLSLPLRYTGDNRFTIPIPNGSRHWRNPDFVVPNSRGAVLLDAYWGKTQAAENVDYRKAGWTILRIAVAELADREWFSRKIRSFITACASCESGPSKR